MSLHSPKIPRHARVFEILRQGDLAADVSHYVQEFAATPPRREQIEAFRQTALRSFEHSDGVAAGAKPRRNHKFFRTVGA